MILSCNQRKKTTRPATQPLLLVPQGLYGSSSQLSSLGFPRPPGNRPSARAASSRTDPFPGTTATAGELRQPIATTIPATPPRVITPPASHHDYAARAPRARRTPIPRWRARPCTPGPVETIAPRCRGIAKAATECDHAVEEDCSPSPRLIVFSSPSEDLDRCASQLTEPNQQQRSSRATDVELHVSPRRIWRYGVEHRWHWIPRRCSLRLHEADDVPCRAALAATGLHLLQPDWCRG